MQLVAALVLETKVMLSFLVWVFGLGLFPLFLAAPFSWDDAETEFSPTLLCLEQSCWSCSRLTQWELRASCYCFPQVLIITKPETTLVPDSRSRSLWVFTEFG